VVAVSKAFQKDWPLIAKPDERLEIVSRATTHRAGSSQHARLNARHAIEPEKTHLADVHGLERHTSENLLQQQERRGVTELREAASLHVAAGP
jgi:hypothetical protein